MKKLVLLSVLAVLLLAPAVMAASTVTFYGRACISTAIVSQDKEYLESNTDYERTAWDNEGSNDFRLGADFKVNDSVTAKVELRGSGTGAGGGSVSIRHWYGLWDFGAGKLLVGRFWTPTFQGLTNSDFIQGSGDVNGSLREDGLQLWFDVGGGSLKIAALTPALSNPFGYSRSYYTIPRLEASYNHKFGPVDMTFFGGYNSCEMEQDAVGGRSDSVDSHLLGLTFAWDPKPAYVKGGLYIGQNLDAYGWGADLLTDHVAVFGETISGVSNLVDTDYFGWVILGGFVVNDRFEIEAGWVHLEAEQDYNGGTAITTTLEASLDEYYVVATYKLADSVYIYPEIAIGRRGDDKTTVSSGASTNVDRGGYAAYGIYWKISF